MIYLDNAATTFPKPQCVLREVDCCQRNYAANPGRGGHKLTMKAGERVFETREKTAAFFGADPSRVIFTLNCTHAVNTALKGILRPGDHVVISSLEHNAVLRPLEKMKTERAISFDVFQVVPGDEEKTIANARALIRPNTRLLFCTHVSNVFGTVLPLRGLSRLARKNGLLFGVDAAQSAGVYGLHLENDGIDLLCMPGHKGLYAPMGVGLLLFSDRVEIDSLTEGGTGTLSLQWQQPEFYPEKLESGTLNLPGIVGLRAGLSFLQSFGGTACVHRYEAELIRLLREDLSVMRRVRVFDNMFSTGSPTLLSFLIDDLSAEQVGSLLDERGFAVRAGFHCAALAHQRHGTQDTGTVRVSPSVFNNPREIKNLSFCINQIALRRNIC